MNWIILYTLDFLIIIAVLCIGFFINNNAVSFFDKHKDLENSKQITASEFSNLLFAYNKLKNINLITLRSKKTNYYSAKYNVIKVAPEVANSIFLFDLAICARCTHQATRQQYNYISSALKLIFDTLAKIVSILLIPITLICAILNISFGLEKISFIISLSFLICYVFVFVIQLVLFFVSQSTTKQIVSNIEKMQILNDSDLKIIDDSLKAINKFNFFNFTRLSLKIFELASPATIFGKSEK